MNYIDAATIYLSPTKNDVDGAILPQIFRNDNLVCEKNDTLLCAWPVFYRLFVAKYRKEKQAMLLKEVKRATKGQ